jgi:uncharacterized membrane protein
MKVQNYFFIYLEKAAILLLFLIVLNCPVIAGVQELLVIDQLNVDRSVLTNMTLSRVEGGDFLVRLPDGAYDVRVSRPYEPTNDSLEIPVQCAKCDVDISYRLDDAAKNENNKSISYGRTLVFPIGPAKVRYMVRLPAGNSLTTQSSLEPSVVPAPTRITSDGQSIIIQWSDDKPNLPQRYFVSYTEHLEAPYARSWSWLYFLFGLALGVVVSIAYIYFQKRRRDQPDVRQVIPISLLNPDEQTVLALLKGHKGHMNQREMVHELGWSKSKVSGVLSNLDYKKVTKRVKFGRNYRVEMIKEIEGL